MSRWICDVQDNAHLNPAKDFHVRKWTIIRFQGKEPPMTTVALPPLMSPNYFKNGIWLVRVGIEPLLANKVVPKVLSEALRPTSICF